LTAGGNRTVAVPNTRVSPVSLVRVRSISTRPVASSTSVTTPLIRCGSSTTTGARNTVSTFSMNASGAQRWIMAAR
jgi:hypothetical protein